MEIELNEIEARIVGCLIEKEATTPDYYPLTLNALTNACNQKTNRFPIVDYDEKTVMAAIERLREKNVVYVFYGSTSRVPKYKHILPKLLELEVSETALICVLLLRGFQTLGELRERTQRMYEFSGLDEVSARLEDLMKRDPPLVKELDKQPGQKERRFGHLLSGEITQELIAESAALHSAGGTRNEAMQKMQEEIDGLKASLEAFRQEFEEFKKQFE